MGICLNAIKNNRKLEEGETLNEDPMDIAPHTILFHNENNEKIDVIYSRKNYKKLTIDDFTLLKVFQKIFNYH